ncbi:MAG: hypothetical protein Q8L21_00720 [Candidatus Komeilibacteria bacterium]|nr:hypothetical protein [Candidatus Komeilibacteria bacterium]
MRLTRANQAGMTIMDLIVSIGIFALLASTMIANFRGGARSEGVRQASRLTESLLRRAQTMTLSGSVLANGDYPDGGYGVRFDISQAGKIFLFSDVNGNFRYDINEIIAENDVLFPNNTTFSLAENLDVVFSPPDGDVYFNGAALPDTKIISFIADGTDQANQITIYRLSGQIRVE